MNYKLDALEHIISDYKKNFTRISEEEIYKWEAVQCFQKNWDIDAENFPEMLSNALAKSENLLTSYNNYAKNMIINLSEKEPATVKNMFQDLFDENQNIIERIDGFIKAADELLPRVREDSWKQHYQKANSVSTYLFFRFPDKYYIYKYTKFKEMALEIGYPYLNKKGSAERVKDYFDMCDEIHAYVTNDQELCDMSSNRLGDNHFADPAFHLLTDDIVYFGSSKRESKSDWWPEETMYHPNLSKEDWVQLLADDTIFTQDSLAVMKRLLHIGGQATCTELSQKYGKTKNYYNIGSSSLAKRVHKATNCSLLEEEHQNCKWWPILYTGKYTGKDNQGHFIWRLRSELKEALETVDLSDIPLFATEEDGMEKIQYWWLNANPKVWSFSNLRVGEEVDYTLYNSNGNKRRVFKNFLDAKEGDFVIGYETSPLKQITALCRVSQENDGEKITFEKVENFSSPIDYSTLRLIPELDDMEYFQKWYGTLFKLTKEEFETIMDCVREQNPLKKADGFAPYSKQDFLSEVYMDEFKYNALVSLLQRKRNIILQGAPGVGKTYTAKRLAYAMLGAIDEDKIKFVQFHQNYSYEDFIMGYKPQGDGFELRYGVFYEFCKKAENDPEHKYFFIIDEINRGNLSRIFGELLMLIEKGYRGTKMTMAYNGLPFTVPENLYIIGMMNTADRSLAMIDYALRRRFSFVNLAPAFYSEGFKKYQAELANETLDALISEITALNLDIANDPSLGPGFCIGHSYFSGQTICTEDWLTEVIEYDILPMLKEYWFDDTEKIRKWESRLRGALND